MLSVLPVLIECTSFEALRSLYMCCRSIRDALSHKDVLDSLPKRFEIGMICESFADVAEVYDRSHHGKQSHLFMIHHRLMEYAIEAGNVEDMAFARDLGASIGWLEIYVAARHNRKDILKLFMPKIVTSINYLNAMRRGYVTSDNNKELIKTFNIANWSASAIRERRQILGLLAQRGNVQMIYYLIIGGYETRDSIYLAAYERMSIPLIDIMIDLLNVPQNQREHYQLHEVFSLSNPERARKWLEKFRGVDVLMDELKRARELEWHETYKIIKDHLINPKFLIDVVNHGDNEILTAILTTYDRDVMTDKLAEYNKSGNRAEGLTRKELDLFASLGLRIESYGVHDSTGEMFTTIDDVEVLLKATFLDRKAINMSVLQTAAERCDLPLLKQLRVVPDDDDINYDIPYNQICHITESEMVDLGLHVLEVVNSIKPIRTLTSIYPSLCRKILEKDNTVTSRIDRDIARFINEH